VRSHGGGSFVIGGGQMVTHGGWQAAQKKAKKQEIRSCTCGEECKHFRHHPAGTAVT
jgi:hypothetical protein